MLASIFSLNVIQTALELGCIYALVALALFLSYSILNIADLSTDGCFTLGCAVACQVALTGHPILALAAAMAAGVCSGFVTAFLQTRLGVESIMAGIIVNTGLYTINLAAMGFSSTMSLVKTETIFSLAKKSLGFLGSWYKLVLVGVIIALACAAMLGFLGTRLGLSIRATGDNPDMVRASSINTINTVTIGLCIANAMTALSGAMLAQYQKTADINLGTGMVIIGLASLIIGETIFGRGGIPAKIVGAVAGSIIYRLIIAVALRLDLPAECLKLISAVIVALAIAGPYLQKKHSAGRRRRQLSAAGDGGGAEGLADPEPGLRQHGHGLAVRHPVRKVRAGNGDGVHHRALHVQRGELRDLRPVEEQGAPPGGDGEARDAEGRPRRDSGRRLDRAVHIEQHRALLIAEGRQGLSPEGVSPQVVRQGNAAEVHGAGVPQGHGIGHGAAGDIGAVDGGLGDAERIQQLAGGDIGTGLTPLVGEGRLVGKGRHRKPPSHPGRSPGRLFYAKGRPPGTETPKKPPRASVREGFRYIRISVRNQRSWNATRAAISSREKRFPGGAATHFSSTSSKRWITAITWPTNSSSGTSTPRM